MEGKGLASTKAMDCKTAVANIVGVMFMNRTIAHMAHLKTGSYAQHKALDEFYNEVIELADELAEAAQGEYGKLDLNFVSFSGSVDSPVSLISDQLKSLQAFGKCIDDDYLANIFQEIEKLYRQTLYKLKELH